MSWEIDRHDIATNGSNRNQTTHAAYGFLTVDDDTTYSATRVSIPLEIVRELIRRYDAEQAVSQKEASCDARRELGF